jgi:hypothetical protein
MRLLTTDFADEMAARDEILKAADEPAPIVPPRATRRTQPPPLPLRPAQGQAVGEVTGQRERQASDRIEAVPSMIVSPGSSRTAVPVAAAGVLDLSSSVSPDSWMVDVDPSTDLLRSHRLRSIRNAAIAIGVLVVLVGAIFFTATRRGGDTSKPSVSPPVADARVVRDASDLPIDASDEQLRDGIVALSHYGFFSITATAKTQIYVDGKSVGETPLTRWPLPPGPHKVKAIGPRGKIKQISINIYGGRDTDEGTITW